MDIFEITMACYALSYLQEKVGSVVKLKGSRSGQAGEKIQSEQPAKNVNLGQIGTNTVVLCVRLHYS